MIKCKQLEKFYTEYACDLLGKEQVAAIEAHLSGCAPCARAVESLQKALRLTEEAGKITVPPVIIDNIERNVYKRLATESPLPKRVSTFSKFFAAFRSPVVKRGSTWVFRSALATLGLVIAISIATVFINQDQSLDLIRPPHERLELYRQAEIQNTRTEALETRHLKGDDRLATLQLLVLTEQGP